MIHVHDVLRRRLELQAGIIKLEKPKPKYTLKELEEQWSDRFELLMRNRLMMGTLRYGKFMNGKVNPHDSITSAIKRLCYYKETGNLEFLVDAANLCMVEFEGSGHPKKHFHATDDTTVHAVKI